MYEAADETQHVYGVALVVIILSAAAIYAFGYVRAVMHRANRDYKTTKAALPGLRKGFWSAWWRAVKRGTVVLLLLFAVVYGWLHASKNADATPAPSPSPTPSHSRR